MGEIPGLTSRNPDGGIPLHDAAKKGREDTVTWMLGELQNQGAWEYRNHKNDSGQTALHVAADGDHYRVVELLLLSKVAINVPDGAKRIPLHLAALKGHTNSMHALLKGRESPNALDMDRQTPLHLATIEGQERAVELLLEWGRDFPRTHDVKDVKDTQGQPPLFYAALRTHEGIAGKLKAAGANIEASKNGQTLLHQMASNGHAEPAAILLRLGADVEALDNSGRTPLYAAAYGNHRDAFLKISERANKNATDTYTGRTLLHRAVFDDSFDAARLLIEIKAATEEKDRQGQTPLYLAATRNQARIAKLLVDEGDADKESVDSNGQTLLHRAARENNHVAAGILCDVGAEKEARDDKGRTPLYVAAELNNKEAVKVLAFKDADVSAPDAKGESLLHRAAREANKNAADLLIGVEAPRNDQDHLGRTPLHVAATHAISVVQKLLDTEAKKELKDINGQTPFHLAASRGDGAVEMMKTLIAYGSRTDPRDKKGQTPMHAAAARGDLDVLIELLENPQAKMAQDSADFSGRTPLHIAAMNGNVDATLLLINEGLNVEAEDKEGRTPLHLAAEEGHVDVIQRLLSKGANRAAKDKYQNYPLNLAAENGHTGAVRILTDTGNFEVPMPETLREYLVYVRKFVQDNFGDFFSANDPRVKNLAETAAKKVRNVCENLNLPRSYEPGLTKLMLYDFVILCDDSSSMHTADRQRIRDLRIILQRITDIALTLKVDDSGISIRFLNYAANFDHMSNANIVKQRVDEVFTTKRSGSALGTKMQEKVVQPLIYDKINHGQFQKGLIAVLITDGQPTDGKRTLLNTITASRRFLDSKGYPKGSVIFLLSQVGDDDSATRYLKGIEDDPEVQGMVYASTERLGSLATSLESSQNEHWYTVQLVKLFVAALGKQTV